MELCRLILLIECDAQEQQLYTPGFFSYCPLFNTLFGIKK